MNRKDDWKKEIHCFKERNCFITAYKRCNQERKKERKKNKQTKWRLGSAWESAQSDQSFRCLHEESLGPYLPIERTAKDWSDWVDAQADWSLRWAQRSFCWFSHEAAHIL